MPEEDIEYKEPVLPPAASMWDSFKAGAKDWGAGAASIFSDEVKPYNNFENTKEAKAASDRQRGVNKLGFMMTMDSGDWRGKGTEYKLQKQQGEGAQQISDEVPRRPMTLPAGDAYEVAHHMSYIQNHEAGVPFEHAGYMWIRDLHGNIVPISESSAFVAKYQNDENNKLLEHNQEMLMESGDRRIPKEKMRSPLERMPSGNSMMTPQQELDRINKSEKDKSEGPAYGFQGMTAGQINEERGVREGRKGELGSQINGSAMQRLMQWMRGSK